MYKDKINFLKIVVLLVLLFFMFISCKRINNDAKITITRTIYAQTEIISPEGIRVLIDVQNIKLLSKPFTDNDIYLTTHGHPDHVNETMKKDYKGTDKLYIQEGKIKKGDVKITGIASLHSNKGEFKKSWGSNYIYLIKIGNLRIAHFGDCG